MKDMSRFQRLALPHKQLGILGFIAAAFSVGSAVLGIGAGKAKRQSAKAERRASEIANFRAIREVIRAARLARAASISNAAGGGAEIGSSGIQGSLQSITARTASSLLINRRIADFQKTAFDKSLKADRLSTFSNVLGSLSNLAFSAADTFGGTPTVPTPTPAPKPGPPT